MGSGVARSFNENARQERARPASPLPLKARPRQERLRPSSRPVSPRDRSRSSSPDQAESSRCAGKPQKPLQSESGGGKTSTSATATARRSTSSADSCRTNHGAATINAKGATDTNTSAKKPTSKPSTTSTRTKKTRAALTESNSDVGTRSAAAASTNSDAGTRTSASASTKRSKVREMVREKERQGAANTNPGSRVMASPLSPQAMQVNASTV